MSAQIRWPAISALFAVVLQCIGCAADAMGTDSSDPRAARSLAEAASPHLATESEFIKGGGISSEWADPVLESGDLFSSALQRMSEDEAESTEAQDLARRYRNALERAVGTQDVVEDLTCGVSLCMGAVSSQSRADRDAWAERLYEDADAVRHVTFDVFEMNGDRLHNRFLFSADVAIKAIVVPADADFDDTRTAAEVRRDARQVPATRFDIDAIAAPMVVRTLTEDRQAGNPEASPYLATESELIVHHSISIEMSKKMLEDNARFSSSLERMRSEERKRVEAQQLARHHREVLERAVGELGVVDDLTCGMSLCIGSVTSLTQAHHEAWSRRLVKDPAARRYGAVHSYEPVGDQLQQRFVFSTDPAVAGLLSSR